MKITEILAFPTSFRLAKPDDAVNRGIDGNHYVTAVPGGYHESLLRSYQIVQKLRELLELNTPAPVILEMLDLMEEKK